MLSTPLSLRRTPRQMSRPIRHGCCTAAVLRLCSDPDTSLPAALRSSAQVVSKLGASCDTLWRIMYPSRYDIAVMSPVRAVGAAVLNLRFDGILGWR